MPVNAKVAFSPYPGVFHHLTVKYTQYMDFKSLCGDHCQNRTLNELCVSNYVQLRLLIEQNNKQKKLSTMWCYQENLYAMLLPKGRDMQCKQSNKDIVVNDIKFNRSFSLSRNKKINRKPSSGKSYELTML